MSIAEKNSRKIPVIEFDDVLYINEEGKFLLDCVSVRWTFQSNKCNYVLYLIEFIVCEILLTVR